MQSAKLKFSKVFKGLVLVIVIFWALGTILSFLFLNNLNPLDFFTNKIDCPNLELTSVEKAKYYPIKSCSQEVHVIEDDTYYLIDLSYGDAHDCPSGCFWDSVSFVVDESGQKQLFTYPSRRFGRALWDRYPYACKVDQRKINAEERTSLIKKGSEYYLRYDYADLYLEGNFGTQCHVNGYEDAVGTEQGDIKINVQFPEIAKCSSKEQVQVLLRDYCNEDKECMSSQKALDYFESEIEEHNDCITERASATGSYSECSQIVKYDSSILCEQSDRICRVLNDSSNRTTIRDCNLAVAYHNLDLSACEPYWDEGGALNQCRSRIQIFLEN